jgi:hypothetical protein
MLTDFYSTIGANSEVGHLLCLVSYHPSCEGICAYAARLIASHSDAENRAVGLNS